MKPEIIKGRNSGKPGAAAFDRLRQFQGVHRLGALSPKLGGYLRQTAKPGRLFPHAAVKSQVYGNDRQAMIGF